MDAALIQKIDNEIEACREQLAEDIIRLIAVPSVKGDPEPGAPFGPGPRAMLDTMLEWGRKDGFYAEDHGVGVIHLAYREGQPDLGIWLHGDVVPVGDGWIHDPFRATRYKGCIIGRGATDNKGQLCAIWNLLKIFRKLEIPLSYLPALYVGSNEETGMADLKGLPGNDDAKGFIHVCTPPRMSLVPDSSFPVGYGGKGSLVIRLKSTKPLSGLTLTAGLDDAPGKGEARIGEEIISTLSAPGHLSNPDPNGNMITKLMDRLLERSDVAPADRPVLDFIRRLSLDIHGDSFGINVPTVMKPLTLAAYRIEMADGCPEISLNIRYPIEISAETIRDHLEEAARPCGMQVSSLSKGNLPYLMDRSNPMIDLLCEIANSVTGEQKLPYTLGGGTYAHVLPNAYAFGMDGCKKPDDYPAGRGGAHGMDELVSLDRLQRAMRIYARTLLALNETEW